MSILFSGCQSKAQQTADNTNSENSKKTIVAYFSCTGTTEKVANAIANTVGGELYRITPAKEYTTADLDWRNNKSRSSVEMADKDSRPELAGETIDIEKYDTIYLGYPIWWDLCPRAVNTFIEKYDLAGKTVIPFATSGSSSITNSVKELRRLYPDIVWKGGKLLNGGAKQAAEWAKQTAR